MTHTADARTRLGSGLGALNSIRTQEIAMSHLVYGIITADPDRSPASPGQVTRAWPDAEPIDPTEGAWQIPLSDVDLATLEAEGEFTWKRGDLWFHAEMP